jgi:BlaI family penicillinase repressor
MKKYKLAESEEKFADIIWQDEPIGSGDNTLKKVCNIYSTKKMM